MGWGVGRWSDTMRWGRGSPLSLVREVRFVGWGVGRWSDTMRWGRGSPLSLVREVRFGGGVSDDGLIR